MNSLMILFKRKFLISIEKESIKNYLKKGSLGRIKEGNILLWQSSRKSEFKTMYLNKAKNNKG